MQSPSKVVLATGGFDPLHAGHIKFLKAAKELGNILVVGLNSSEWLYRKKGREFMPWSERAAILENIVGVDQVIQFDDSDNSAKNAIKYVRYLYPNYTVVFANGGDRHKDNIPELDIDDPLVEFAFGVGGAFKVNSSSWLLQEWKAAKTVRPWGYYRVLHEVGPGVKLKELTVEPNKSLSMQKHKNRKEFWFVAEGTASVYTLVKNKKQHMGDFAVNSYLHIDLQQWHQLKNKQNVPLKIIEIQYGAECLEEDIVRKNDV